jgi:hypothetical protein
MKKTVLLVILTMTMVSGIYAQIVKTQVGFTKYDLQTNNSIERRIVVEPISNEMVVTYTGSADPDNGAGTFTNRGTGYYYYSGAGAMTPQTTFPGRIEGTDRVGWPNPIFLPGGFEAVIAHRASSSTTGLAFSKRKTGTPTWTLTTANSGDLTWPRMANSGDSIFAISSTLTGNINGMSGGVGFTRSYNGGSTWTPSAGLDSIPGINVGNYPNSGTANVLGGDEYAVDVKGQRVAVLTGALDVTLNFSNDFGNTWVRKVLIAGDNNTADTLASDNRSGGDYSVLIDNNGKIHCFWGQLYGNNITNTLARAGIMYWNEYMSPTEKPRLLNKTMYEKEAGVNALIYLPFFTTQVAQASTNQSNYGSSHTSQPSSGIDAAGNIYLSYMRLRGISDTNRFLAGKNTDATGMLLNDCYLMKSVDSGKTWIGPINVSSSDSMESAFPSIARHVNGAVHMVYQEDPLYGFAISSTTPGHNGATSDNKIIYAKIPVTDIVNSPDITPPILRLHDSFFIKTGFQSTFGTDTFVFYRNCATEMKTGLSFTELKKYLAWGMDNVDEGNVLYIDTPLSGINFNVAGFYKYTIYAKDAAGNVSTGSFTSGGSRDTFKFVIQVVTADVTLPTITLNKKLDYVYKGSAYTLPLNNFTASDDNPCGSVSVTSPNVSSVDVNTAGIYYLIYTAKDASNNTSKDTLIVYVGKEPIPAITNEVVNATTKKLTANGDQTQDTFPIVPTSYQWKYKLTGTAGPVNFSSAATKNLTNYSIPASITKFDSLCLEASNLYNLAPFNKAKITKCKALKYALAGINSLNKDISIDIFPNPNNGTFNVKINGIKTNQARLVLTNMEGRTVSDNTYKINNSEIPFSTPIGKGTYFMTTEVDGNVYLDKIEVK